MYGDWGKGGGGGGGYPSDYDAWGKGKGGGPSWDDMMAQWNMMQMMNMMWMGKAMGKGEKGAMMPAKGGPSGPGKGQGRKSGGGDTKEIFVGALPKDVTEWAISDFFSQFGPISEVKMKVHDSGESKGYCFVLFEDKSAAQAAIDNYDHNRIGDKWVDCKPSDGGKGAKPGDWTCPNCGDLVFAKRDSCNLCGYGGSGMGRPMSSSGGPTGSKGKPGDWICHACGDLVFSYRDKCNKCGEPKKSNSTRQGQRPGDWTCPSCGDLVFASKDKCSMCKTPKPSGNGAMSGRDGPEYGAMSGRGGKGAYMSHPY